MRWFYSEYIPVEKQSRPELTTDMFLSHMNSHTFIRKNVSGKHQLTIEAKHPLVVVVIPSKGKITYAGEKVLANDMVIDYQYKTIHK